MKERVQGKTGESGVDGILNYEQTEKLNALQKDASDTAFTAINNRSHDSLFPLISMATGIGKGNIIHRVVEKQIRQRSDSKILIIAGTKVTLVGQTHDALEEYQSNSGEYISAEDDEQEDEETMIPEDNPLRDQQSFLYKTGAFGDEKVNVQVATIQKVVSEVSKGNLNPEEYDLVIVDEVHNIGTPTRKKIIQRFDRVTGLTATPHRHSGKFKKPEDYGFEQVVSYTLPEAQEDGLLPPLVGIQIDTKEILNEIPTNPSGAIDYRELEKLLKEHPELRSHIADKLTPIIAAPDGHKYKTVVAVNFVWEAQELAELLADKGIKVGVAVNKRAAKRIHTDEIPSLDSIERYKLPETDPNAVQVLISPYVASEGFDAPFTEAMVWASPTDSPLRYTQYTGRLARRAPGKKFGVVIDCVYQTAQYGWSYNMGMWMKDYVTQLDNGMLYMGPVSDIESLNQLPSFTELSNTGDRKTIKELQQVTDPVQPNEIILTTIGMGTVFIGERGKTLQFGMGVAAELEKDHPEFFAQRLSGNKRLVRVITEEGRADFITLMLEKGIKERPKDEQIEKVKDTDIPITQKGMPTAFFGSDVFGIGREVYTELVGEHPEWFVTRLSGNRRITVVTEGGRAAFTAKMIERGVRVRDTHIETAKPTDFTLTQRGDIDTTFESSISKPNGILIKLVRKLEEEHPEWFAERKRPDANGSYIKVVVEEHKDAFTAAMVEGGAKILDSDMQPVTAGDFIIFSKAVISLYSGGSQRKATVMREVTAALQAEHPDWFVKKKNKAHTVPVLLPEGLDAFHAAMADRGIYLRK